MSTQRSPTSPEGITAVLEEAKRVRDRERRQVADERIAFAQFLERVQTIEPVPQRTVDSARRTLQSKTGIVRVRDAYTETVMNVPHYHEAYGEPYAENLAAEFSEELAAALTRETHLEPPLKRTLLEAIRHAVTTRQSILELIERERDELERMEADLVVLVDEFTSLSTQPIDRLEFNALRLTRTRLHQLREGCDDLAARRQTFVRSGRMSLGMGEGFCRYLYRDCERTYPLLSAIATLGDRIGRELERVDGNLVTIA